MMNYRNVTLAIAGLCLSLSFLASPVLAEEKDGVMMKDGKVVRLSEGKDIGRMDRETTLSNGAKVSMNGKLTLKDGKEMQLQEGQIVMLDGKMIEGPRASSFLELLDLTTPDVLAASGAQRGSAPPVRLATLGFLDVQNEG